MKVIQTSNCHTLDRSDLFAQKDKCGLSTNSEEYKLAVDLKFNITHWPYIQSSLNYGCIQRFFNDSYTNYMLGSAAFVKVGLFSAAALMIVF